MDDGQETSPVELPSLTPLWTMVPCLVFRLNSELTNFWTIQYVNLLEFIDQELCKMKALCFILDYYMNKTVFMN